MGYQTPQMGSGAGGFLDFLQQGLQAYSQAHGMKREEKQQQMDNKRTSEQDAEKKKMDESQIEHGGLENKVLQAGLEGDAAAKTTANAQNTYDNVVRQAANYPQILQDPSISKGFIEAANALHRPIVRNKDGSINMDSIMPKQFSDLSVDEKAAYSELPPDQRKAQMKGIGGVPGDFMSAKSTHTFKEETERIKAGATVTRAQTGQKAEQHKEFVDNTKLTLNERLTAAKTEAIQSNSATNRAKAFATINKLNAEVGKLSAETQAIPARLALQGEGLSLRSQQLQVSMARLQHNVSNDALKDLHSTVTSLDAYSTKVQSAHDGAERDLTAYLNGTGHTTDDPIAQKLQAQISNLNNQLYMADRDSKKARSALMSHQFQGNAISRNSGKQSSILPRANQPQQGQPIGNAPSGTPDGKTTSYNGKTLTARGGKWYAQ